MRAVTVETFALLLAGGLLVGGCGGDDSDIRNTPGAGAEASLPQTNDPVQIDPADFTTAIDNEYWPMRPGTRWTYRSLTRKAASYGWS